MGVSGLEVGAGRAGSSPASGRLRPDPSGPDRLPLEQASSLCPCPWPVCARVPWPTAHVTARLTFGGWAPMRGVRSGACRAPVSTVGDCGSWQAEMHLLLRAELAAVRWRLPGREDGLRRACPRAQPISLLREADRPDGTRFGMKDPSSRKASGLCDTWRGRHSMCDGLAPVRAQTAPTPGDTRRGGSGRPEPGDGLRGMRPGTRGPPASPIPQAERGTARGRRRPGPRRGSPWPTGAPFGPHARPTPHPFFAHTTPESCLGQGIPVRFRGRHEGGAGASALFQSP